MPSSPHYFIECLNPECRFRFPISGRKLSACPDCRQTRLAITPIEPSPVERSEIIQPTPFRGALLDNIRSIHNVGSIFRTADGLALDHLYLCGLTATPEHPRLAKTALGSENAIHWSHHRNAVETITLLKDQGFQIWALEGGNHATSLFDLKSLSGSQKIILTVGNEITGVDPDILNLCHSIFYIPMQGIKGSLNVSVAFGVAAYFLKFSVQVI